MIYTIYILLYPLYPPLKPFNAFFLKKMQFMFRIPHHSVFVVFLSCTLVGIFSTHLPSLCELEPYDRTEQTHNPLPHTHSCPGLYCEPLPVQKMHLSTNSNVALISLPIILHLLLKGCTIVQKASEQHLGQKSRLTTVVNCICAPPHRKKVVPPSQVFTQVWLCNRFN